MKVLNVTTTVPYIRSIVDGQADIADKMTIHQMPWYNFLDTSGKLQVLLSAFEGFEFKSRVEPTRPTTTQVALQETKINAPSQGSKRPLDDRGEMHQKKSKITDGAWKPEILSDD